MKAAVASLAPDASVLGGNLYLQSFSLEIKVQTGSAYDKVGVVLDVRVLVVWGADAAVPDFTLSEHLKVGRQFLCKKGGGAHQQGCQCKHFDGRCSHRPQFSQIYNLLQKK